MIVEVKIINIRERDIENIIYSDNEYERKYVGRSTFTNAGRKDTLIKKRKDGLFADAIVVSSSSEQVTELELDNAVFKIKKTSNDQIIKKEEEPIAIESEEKTKTETIKERAIYVYLPTQEMADKWKELAETSNISISKFVIEHVERSLTYNMEKKIGSTIAKKISESKPGGRPNYSNKEKRIRENQSCPICNKRDMVVKDGERKTQSGKVQTYKCKRCNRKFTANPSKKKILATLTALDLYDKGLSMREIVTHVDSTYGIDINYATISYWIKKYNELLKTKEHMFDFLSETDRTKTDAKHRLRLWHFMTHEVKLMFATSVAKRKEVL